MGALIGILMALMLGVTGTGNTEGISEIEEIDAWFTEVACEDFDLEPWEINLYYTDEIDYDQLTTRKERGEIMVERMVGVVLDNEGNGEILTTEDDYYNYISYSMVDFANPGDYVVTYCLYNPATDYEDDVFRYDYPISSWGK